MWIVPDNCIIFGGECLINAVKLFGSYDVDLRNNVVLVTEVNAILIKK